MKRALLIIIALAICVGAAAQATSKATDAKSSGKSPVSQTQSQTPQAKTKSSAQTQSQTNQTKQSANNKQGAQSKQSAQKTDDKEKTEDNKKDVNHFNFGITAAPGLHYFVNNNGKPGIALQLKAGANATIPILLPDLYLQPGARLALRTGGTHYTGQLSNVYLEVPVFAGYNFRLGDLALFVEAGPYAGLRIIPLVHGIWDPKSAWSCPLVDIGLGVNAGVELSNKIRLSAGFDRGFISPCRDDHAHNGGFWITATYLLR